MKRQTAETFYDLAVGNVPFGNYKVSDKPYDKLGFSIHNYFFAKALDQVRPGGIVAFVTSRYTMDSKNRTRESIWRNGQNCWEPFDFLTTHSVPMPVQM